MKLSFVALTIFVALVVAVSVDCYSFFDDVAAASYYLPSSRYEMVKRRLADALSGGDEDEESGESAVYNYNNMQLPMHQEHPESLQKTLEALLNTKNAYDEINNGSDEDEDSISDLINANLNGDATADDDEIKADPRDEESESHSSLGAGHQYVSGGAGEGKQHLQPDGNVPNVEEVKSDEDLPAYCDPPNPCPVGYVGEDCDPRPYIEYTAEYSKNYQDQQNCMCDDDHNECHNNKNPTKAKVNELLRSMQSLKQDDKYLSVVAKKSPRVRRDVEQVGQAIASGAVKKRRQVNPYLKGQAIKTHVVKKLAPTF